MLPSTFRVLKSFFVLLTVSFLTSCGSDVKDNDEDTPIDNAFILESNKTIKNMVDLDSINIELKLVHAKAKQLAPGENWDFKEYDTVNLTEAVAALFDPNNHPCSLPEKVKRKLNKLKNDNQAWAPKYVKEQVGAMPSTVYHVRGKSLALILHEVMIKKADGTSFPLTMMGAPTFRTMNVEDYIVTSGFNSFVYKLDCSGYLNAAIEGAAVVPGADIKGNASSSIDKQTSMFIGGGVVISPLYGAVYAEQLGLEIDTLQRIKILQALIKNEGLADNDIIDVPPSYEVIWASKQGNAGFNGKGSISGKGGVGIGVAQVAGSMQTSGEITVRSGYTNFDIYLTKRARIPEISPIVVKNIKELITKLKPKA